MLLKLPVQPVIGHGIGLQSPQHLFHRIRLPDRASQAIFPHQAADLLVIHSDSHPNETHMDSPDAFVITTELIGCQD